MEALWWVLGGATVVLILYISLVGLILGFSLRPLRIHQYVSPGMLGFPQERVAFQTSDGLELYGWWSEGGGETVMVCVHGYIMNRCEWVPVQTFLSPRGVSFLHFDLRAHGRSQGKRIGFGRDETADVVAAIDWVKEKAPGKKIVLLGSSMGGVACAHAAVERAGDVDALILDGAYRRLDEAMAGWWPFLGGSTLARLMRPSQALAPMILGFRPSDVQTDRALRESGGVPVLLLYGGADPLIAAESVQEMRSAGGESAELVMFDGATHGAGRLQDPEKFRVVVTRFLEGRGFL